VTALDKVSDGLIREVTLHALFFGVVLGVVSYGEVLIDRSKRATSRTTSDSGAFDLTVIWTVNFMPAPALGILPWESWLGGVHRRIRCLAEFAQPVT